MDWFLYNIGLRHKRVNKNVFIFTEFDTFENVYPLIPVELLEITAITFAINIDWNSKKKIDSYK